MSDLVVALLLASPWIVAPAVTIARVRRSRDLADAPSPPAVGAPLVSVIIPARDERRHIEAVIRSVLASRWTAIEVVVVDDHSADGTGTLARAAAAADSRVRVLDCPDLPAGWFGKPWACAAGARAARGEILCFTDADARHGPELLPRAVRVMQRDGLDMLSVAGRQALGSFWERVVQPHVFWMLASRYGGTEAVNRSTRVADKLANGQCIFVRRMAYDRVGGHAAVHDQVAEDVMLAQRMYAAGLRTAIVLGRRDLTTRMYESLGEIVRGWRKNVFAGGRGAMPWGRVGQRLFPVLLLLSPLLTLAPPAVLLAVAVSRVPGWLGAAAAIAAAAELVTWALVYRWMQAPVRYAALFPLGSLVLLAIIVQAIGRGHRVAWKGREYRMPPPARHTPR